MNPLYENKFTEFKREYTKTFLKTVSAFANYHHGKILFGVDDTGDIVGVDNSSNLRLAIEHSIADSMEPVPYYEILDVCDEGKTLVVLEVFKGEHTPYYTSGKAYYRFDTASVPVDRNMLSELILNGRNLSYDGIDSSAEHLSFTVLASRMKQVLEVSDLNHDLLKTLMLKKQNQFTKAAELFSDYNPITHAMVNLIAYEDHTVMHIVDRDMLQGISVIEQFEGCLQFFKKHIKISEKIEGAYRETHEEIPFIAYREAIANALVHRDYFRNASIRVEIFSDRVEIISPGTLPVGISVDEFESGSVSLVRNPIIADVFRRLKIIEKFGTGIRRIKVLYQKYDQKASFHVRENSVTVCLPKVFRAVDSKVEEAYSLPYTDKRELKILECLSINGQASRSDIEEGLNLGRSQCGALLKTMKDRGLILQIGKGRTTHYILRTKM